MTKTELIEKVSQKAALTKVDSARAVNAILEATTEALQAGEKVQLVGFGTFDVRDRAAREGRDPSTGKPVAIPAMKVPSFKAGAALKAAVRG